MSEFKKSDTARPYFHLTKADLDPGEDKAMLALAKEKFIGLNHAAMAAASGSVYHAERNAIESRYLDMPYLVSCEDAGAAPAGHDGKLTQTEHAILLHYLTDATGRPLTGEYATIRDFKESLILRSSFSREINQALEKACGHNPEMIYKALDVVRGEKVPLGDAAIRVNIFPRFPATFVLWAGDGEIPASASVLFDKRAKDYLSNLEDIAFLTGNLLYDIIDIVTSEKVDSGQENS